MAAQTTLLLLIVALSIACIQGQPGKQSSTDLPIPEETTTTTSSEEHDPKYQLIVDTFNNFKDLSLDYVNEAQNISNAILKDETLLAHGSSAEIQAFKQNITDFLEQANNYQEDEELFDLVDVFANATEFYMALPDEAITPDTAVIIATLRKYGSDKLEQKCNKLFDEYVEKFKLQFEETKPFLKEETAMLEWFEHFKTLTEADDKVAALGGFGTFY